MSIAPDQGPNIIVPSLPKRFALTESMLSEFIEEPALAAQVFFGEVSDEFQKVRLKTYVWVPRVIDSSGISSFKTRTFFIAWNLRCLLIPDHVSGVFYQNFSIGQQNFWQYFDFFLRRSSFFRAHVGRMSIDNSETQGKAMRKDPSCCHCHYKNSSHLMLPAPGFAQDARNLAGMRLNDAGFDEYTKVEESSGSEGMDEQLGTRATRASFNKHHPFWCNHVLFLASAEDMQHPSYARYIAFKREAERGNPDYSVISFSFKDVSDRPSSDGIPFREKLVEDRVLKDMRKLPRAKYLQTVLGIWSKNGRAWYDPDALEAAIGIGRKLKLAPCCSRKDYEGDKEKVQFFLGVDPAKSDGKKSDDGAMAVLAAEPKTAEFSPNPEDWKLSLCWAYKVRNADASQWSALIHLKERHFKFSGICMDHGGGGQWIRPELAKPQQIILDMPCKVVPICTPDEAGPIMANHCLIMFSHGDPSIQAKWEHIKGADNLKDVAHTEMKDVLDRRILAWPMPLHEWPKEERQAWPPEKEWACRLLDKARRQFATITLLTDDQGKPTWTKHNARQFDERGKNDFAYAILHAVTRFMVWLHANGNEVKLPDEDAALGW